MYPEFRLCPMNDTRDRKKKKILNHTFTTILGEENVFNVDPPFPLNSVGCYKPNTFYRTSTLFEGGGGGVRETLVKAVFMSVYCRLAANSI